MTYSAVFVAAHSHVPKMHQAVDKDHGYIFTETPGGAPVKSWTRGVPVEEEAWRQVQNVARLPFLHKHVAVMPDVHWGFGATVGSVIPTAGAIIPAAVGVDIGCGMMATRTSLTAADLPDNLSGLRAEIERRVPHGRTQGRGRDVGSWGEPPVDVATNWEPLRTGLADIVAKAPKLTRPARRAETHLGTLGTGNHFIEICIDEQDLVWAMLHSGSRGIGNAIGRYFIERAKEDMRRYFINLPDADLAYLVDGTTHFHDYVKALSWAQRFAFVNRETMMARVLDAVREAVRPFERTEQAVNCHHNYVARENHFGKNIWVTRKGAVRARKGDLGIIPGSMGARSYIVAGKGEEHSFHSCSHGAGRTMSRGDARRTFTLEDHRDATTGVECRKDEGVLDETPGAYKDIDAVMAAQASLVEVVHTLKQVVCVKG